MWGDHAECFRMIMSYSATATTSTLQYVMTELLSFLESVVESDWFKILLGFVLGIVSAVILDRRKERMQATRVSQMLSHEIDYNLTLIAQLRSKVDELHFHMGTTARNRIDQAILVRRLADIPFGDFEKAVWKGQMTFIPAALKSAQITKVMEFYSKLAEIEVLRSKMARLEVSLDRQTEQLDRGLRNVGLSPEFTNDPYELWERLYSILGELAFSFKNPLRQGAS